MNDNRKTKAQLLEELVRERTAELSTAKERLERELTEHKRTEEALRAASQYTRSLIEANLDPLVTISPQGKITDANQATEAVTGVPRERLIGSDFSDYFTKPENAREGYRQVFSAGTVSDYPLTIRHASGRLRDVLYNASVYRNESGEVQGVFAAAREITGHKRAEQEIRPFSQAVESSIEGIAVCDAQCRISYANETFARMFGYSTDELIGKDIAFIYSDEQTPKLKDAISTTMEGGWTGELVGKKKDGACFPVAISSSRVVDDEGNVIGGMASHRDISEHKRAERALRESEELFRTVVDASKDAMVAINAEGLVTIFNPAAEAMFGRRNDEVIGQPLDCLVPEEHRAPHRKYVRSYFATGSPYNLVGKTIELPALRSSGEVFPVELSLSAGQRAEQPLVLAVIRDITQRKRAEEDLRRRDAILEAVAYAAQRFFRAASGDRDVDAVLARLGRAASVSRVYVFENHTDTKGELLVSQRYEWVAPGVTAQLDNPDTQAMPWHSGPMRRWAAILGSGEVVSGNVRDFPPSEQQVLSPQDIRSILSVPIFVHDEWWGFIGFDECTRERQWSAAETEALKVAGATLGAAIQRKRAEEALRESEERYRVLFEQAPDSIVLVDAEKGTPVEFNNRACERLGYTRAEFQDLRVADLEVIESHEQVLEHAAKIVHEGDDTFETRQKTKTGEIRDVLVISQGISIGGRQGALGIWHDITERKRAEQALHESEARYRQLFATVSDAIVVFEAETLQFVDVNDAALKLYGYSKGEFLKLRHPDITAERDQSIDSIRQTLAGQLAGIPLRYHKKKDGTIFPVEISASTLTMGNRRRLCGVIRDITERKRAEEALKESEERYRTLVENVADGVGLLVNGKISYANPALCAMLGRTAEEIQGRSPEEFHVPEQRRPTAERVRAVLDGARVPLAKSTYVRPDGSHVDIEITSTRIRWAGRPALLSVIRDITQRQRAEEEKASLKEQLYQAQKMQAVGHVAAGIAHDFGSLLGVMRGGIRRLRAESAPDDAMRETLGLIEQAEQEATGVTQSLLMFSRRLPTERKPLELGQLIRQSEPILRHLLPGRVELRVDTCRRPACWVKADRTQLQQILLNLVINARDAMSDGGTVEISVTPAGDDSRDSAATEPSSTPPAVRLAVRDTGVGIPPDVRPHIFEPFFTTRPAGRGTGLGLATVQSITRDHGGWIELETAVGHGSTFTVVLPGISAESATAVPAAPVPAGRGEVVLLEESNRHIRRLITSTLRSWNYQVVLPAEGGSAYESLQQQTERVALLILDTDPPAHDRCECLRRIRAAGHRMPVILTVQASDPQIEDPLDTDTVVLRKPFQMFELGACLADLLACQPPPREGP